MAADGKAEPPALLQLAWWCERYNSLPEAGGVHDQDYQEFRTMQILANVYQTITYMRNLQGHHIHRLTTQQRRLIRWLLDNKLWQM